MSRSVRWLVMVVVVMALCPLWGIHSQFPAHAQSDGQSPAAAVETRDDEVILILSTGHIKVEDPYQKPGTDPAVWQSPEGGWTFVTTGDFNGDGDAEIVALGGSRAKIYDPFPVGGTPASLDINISPHTWHLAAAGDIDRDGRDELLLLRHDTGTYAARLLVYDGNPTATSWTVIQNIGYGAQWLDMALGNFLGDERKELVLTRAEDNLLLVLNAQTGQEITRNTPGHHFYGLATGDVNRDGYDEIIGIRDVLPPGNAVVIFKVTGAGQPLQVVHQVQVGSPFNWVTTGDYDKDNAAEVALLRNVDAPYKGLFGIDLVSPLITLNEVVGPGWTDMQSGDTDGDGYVEVLILKNIVVRAYEITPLSIIWSKGGDYRSVFATGNVDGAGLVAGPTLSVSPTSLSFQMEFHGPNPASQRVNVSNSTGSEVIHWTTRENPAVDWLSVTPTSGTTPGSFQVVISGSTLPAGNYATQVIVDGGANVRNSPITVTVSLQVIGPVLEVSPTSLSFQMDYGNPAPPAQYLEVDNSAGSQSIHWTARTEPAVDWLALSPLSGNTPSTVAVSVVAERALPGTHTTNVVIDGGPNTSHSPFSVPVTLVVRAPTMQVSPNTISVLSRPGGAIPRKVVRITQVGGGSAINWVAGIIYKTDWDSLLARADAVEEIYVSEDGVDAVIDGEQVHIDAVSWITIYPTRGTTPADLYVEFNTTAVGLGVHEATIVVDGGSGVLNRLGWCDVKMTLVQPMNFIPFVVKARE